MLPDTVLTILTSRFSASQVRVALLLGSTGSGPLVRLPSTSCTGATGRDGTVVYWFSALANVIGDVTITRNHRRCGRHGISLIC